MKTTAILRRVLPAGPRTVLRRARAFVPPAGRMGAGTVACGYDFKRVSVSAPARDSASTSAPAGAPIQRVLNVNHANVPADIRKALRRSVTNFNNYGQATQNTQHALHQQFAMLDGIERRVNSHLRDNSANITDTQRQELFALLNQTQQHHVGLTQRNLAAGNDLWIRNASQLSQGERTRRQNLWRSLTTGAGNVKVVSNDANFRHQTHSDFAQLLQGQHGTDLLSELNRRRRRGEATGAGRHVVISDDHSQDLRAIYAPHVANAAPGSWAEAHAGATQRGGSQVQVRDGGPPATLEEYQSDATGRALHAPRYITLGHELGHARHILRGTLRPSQWHGGEPELAGQELERRKWTNPEEYVNITTEENPLRAEHDLAQRQYHGDIRTSRFRTNEHTLRTRFNQLFARVPARHRPTRPGQRTEIGTRFGQVSAVLHGTDFADAGQVATATGHLDTLENELPGRIRTANWNALKSGVRSALTPTRGKVAAALGVGALGLAWWNRQQLGL